MVLFGKILPQPATVWEKVVRWFGYKLHLVVDAKYEPPVAYSLTAANEADTTHLPAMGERIETVAGDKGEVKTTISRSRR